MRGQLFIKTCLKLKYIKNETHNLKKALSYEMSNYNVRLQTFIFRNSICCI